MKAERRRRTGTTAARRRPNGRGFVLIVTLWILILLFLIGGVLVEAIRSEMRTELALKESHQAYFLADAGVDYVRALATTRARAALQVPAGGAPGGARMPAASSTTLLSGFQRASDGTWVLPSALTVPDDSGAVQGAFQLQVSVDREPRGAAGAQPDPGYLNPNVPAGNSWLPILTVKSTGLLGGDPVHPQATRSVLAVLVPVTPTPQSAARIPDPALFTNPNQVRDPPEEPPTVRIFGLVETITHHWFVYGRQPQASEIAPYLPSYAFTAGVYELASFQDLGCPDSANWNRPYWMVPEPQTYPPVNASGQSAWWPLP